MYHLTNSLTEIKPHTAITNQPEDSKDITIEKEYYKESNLEGHNFEDQF